MRLVRRMYRGGKVWAEVDEEGGLVTDGAGLTSIRYREDDDRTYSARADEVLEIDPAALEARRRERARARAEGAGAASAEEADTLVVFTHGACFGNPGSAGIGVVLEWRGQRREISRSVGPGTTNSASLVAIREGLLAVRRREVRVRLHTDSAYAVGVLDGGWAVGQHAELVAEIQGLRRGFRDLALTLARGGEVDPRGDRADQLARDSIPAAG